MNKQLAITSRILVFAIILFLIVSGTAYGWVSHGTEISEKLQALNIPFLSTLKNSDEEPDQTTVQVSQPQSSTQQSEESLETLDVYQDLVLNGYINEQRATSLLTRAEIEALLLRNSLPPSTSTTTISFTELSGLDLTNLTNDSILKYQASTGTWVVATDAVGDDEDTTYSAGNGLDLDDTTFSLGGTLGSDLSFVTAGYNTLFSGTGKIGIGTTSPTAFLDIPGSSATVASARIRTGVQPSSANVGDLYSDGTDLFFYNGSSWDDLTNVGGASSIADDSLDFTKLADALTLDVTTSINTYTGTNDANFRIYNSDSGDENLFIDGSTGNVGIGTSSPLYRLDVNGTVRINNPLVFDIEAPDTTRNNIILTSTRAPSPALPGQGKSILIGGTTAETGGDFGVVNIGGTSAGGDNSYFNVLIGYNSIATVQQPGIVAVGKSATASGPNATAIGRDTSAAGYSLALGYNAKALGATSASIGAGTVSTDNLFAYGGVSTKHYFAGNVGIGTATPEQRLSLAGNLAVGASNQSISGTDYFYLGSRDEDYGNLTLNYTGSAATGQANSRIALRPRNGADSGDYEAAGIVFQEGGVTGSGNRGSIQFYTNSGSGPNQRMVIDENGNVGIGTSSPTEKLNVSGNIKFTNFGNKIIFDTDELYAKIETINANLLGYASSRMLHNYGYGGIAFSTNLSTYGLVLNQTGNVGIGTTSPSTLLSLGNTSYTFAASGLSFGDGDTGLYESADDKLNVRTGGSDRVTVDSSGNVGIGTSSPSAKMHVVGSSDTAQLKIAGNSTQTNNILEVQDSSGNVLTAFGNRIAQTNAPLFTVNPTKQLIQGNFATFYGYNASSIAIAQSHNPTNNTGLNSPALRFAGSWNNSGTITSPSGQILFEPVDSSSNHGRLHFGVYGGTDVTLYAPENRTARLGINTVSPVAQLHVVPNYLGRVGQIIQAATSQSADLMQWRDSSGNAMSVVDASGNVGIGTTSPDGPLVISEGVSNVKTKVDDNAIYFSRSADGAYVSSISNAGVATTSLTYRAYDNHIFTNVSDIQGFAIWRDSSAGNLNRVRVGSSLPSTSSSIFSINGNAAIGASYINTNAPANGLIVEGNIGIGTTSPSTLLSLGNTSYTFAASGLSFGDGDSGLYESADDKLNVRTGGTDRVTVDSSGNVGIGTTTPSAKLDIIGGIELNDTITFNSSGGSTITGSAGGDITTTLAGNGTFNINPFGGGGFAVTNGSFPLLFAGDATSANNVAERLVLSNRAPSTTTGVGNRIKFQANNANSNLRNLAYFDTFFTTTTQGSEASALTFSLSQGDGGTGVTVSEKLRLTSTGSLGLGTTSPSTLLSLGNTSYTFAASGLSFGDGDTGLYESADDKLNVRTGGTDRVTVDGSGNVGIGTSSPTDKLTVSGGMINMPYVVNKTLGYRTFLGNTEGALWGNYSLGDQYKDRLVLSSNWYKQDNGTNVTYTSKYPAALFLGSRPDYSTYQPFQFMVGNVNSEPTITAMVINPTGYVGIGTTSPSRTLDIEGSLQLGGSGFIYDNRDNAVFSQSSSATVGNRDLTIGNATYSRISFPNGNVGIGTTSPGTKLSVAGLTSTSSFSLVRVDPTTGDFYYDASSQQYKDNIQTLEDDFTSLLDLDVKSYLDIASGNLEIGVIAEDLDELGLTNLVTYKNGVVDGVKYEKIALYNLMILKQHEQRLTQFADQLALDESGMLTTLSDRVAGLESDVEILQQQQSAFSLTDSLLTFLTDVTFNLNVAVRGKLELNKDTFAEITVPAGSQKIHITFEQPYTQKPSVLLSPQRSIAQSYAIENITTEGFDVVFSDPLDADAVFTWFAAISAEDDNSAMTVIETGEVAESEEELDEASEQAEEPTPVEPVEPDVESSDSATVAE